MTFKYRSYINVFALTLANICIIYVTLTYLEDECSPVGSFCHDNDLF